MNSLNSTGESISSVWNSKIEKILAERDASIPTDSLLMQQLPDSKILDVTGIPQHCGLLTEEELNITENYSASELVQQLSQGRFTAVKVLRAYLKRAGIAHQLTNCVTEFLTTEAMERAAYLDEQFQKNGKPVGPLHGLPISVKDYISMFGRRTEAGWMAWMDRIAQDDALILKILYQAGAIFFVRTTQPQSLMQLECISPIYGVTTNPFNRNLSCGGSTGGEGALLGMKASPMGVGTDIGGSVRSPAANNGVYGLRPTTFRIPKLGLMGIQIGRESIIGVIGPLVRCREDLNLFMKTIIDSEPWFLDPSLVPIPWRSITLDQSKFTVAVLWDDGVVHPHPPILRALNETVEMLKKNQVRIIEWEPIDHQYAWDLTSALYYCNGAEEEFSLMRAGDEKLLPLTEWILNQPNIKQRTWTEMNDLISKRDQYRCLYMKTWNEREALNNCTIDCLLTPVGPSAAPQHGTAKWWGYTSQWNLLDYPAVVFPVTRVDPVKDQRETLYQPRNTLDEENYRLYTSPESYANAPVGLQIVCRRFQDEKTIECLAVIEQIMGRK